MVSKMGESTLNRVHPEKDEHSPAYYAQLAPTVSKIELAKVPVPSLHTTSAKGQEAFDPVVVVPPPGAERTTMTERSNTASRHSWQLLAKAAVLIGAINPKDRNVIDIYHAPKVGNSRFMIHPNSKLRRLWDIATAGLVLYVIIVVMYTCLLVCCLFVLTRIVEHLCVLV